MRGGDWLEYSYATFQIFSGDAVDGTDQVENGDVVGFKYPYSSNSAWLTYFGHQFFPLDCSSKSKKTCAAKNKPTGFVIFKKKWSFEELNFQSPQPEIKAWSVEWCSFLFALELNE